MLVYQEITSLIFSGRKGLEQRTYQDDERIATLEQQLAEAQLIAEDSDRKYDEVRRFILQENLEQSLP